MDASKINVFDELPGCEFGRIVAYMYMGRYHNDIIATEGRAECRLWSRSGDSIVSRLVRNDKVYWCCGVGITSKNKHLLS